MLLEERKEKLIAVINNLPEDKLSVVEEILSKINDTGSSTIEHIYSRAVAKYHETLQKLAK